MDELDYLPELRTPDRWELVRDAAVLQGKLFVDGIRDWLLMPISLVAALLDILGVGKNAGRHFYHVILLGRQTEKWINLFGAAEHILPAPHRASSRQGLDLLVDRLENVVVNEYERGGMTKSAKEAVDKALNSLNRSQTGN